ncbi:aldehyde dehydrogenase family protein [Paraburkholderia sp. D1E]|uniref:aldehyde dehydrogenase family protein n=1 Tax=Paraburkholderia sp. D1E TaxID=3461398 RepID=UPI004045EEA3
MSLPKLETSAEHIAQHTSGKSNLKRVWLELGGKSPNIVMPDAATLIARRMRRLLRSGSIATMKAAT